MDAVVTAKQAALQIKQHNVTLSFAEVNELLRGALVEMTYHGVDRRLYFKSIKVNKQGGVYLSCVELERGAEQHERFKHFSLGKVEDFDIAACVSALRIIYDWPEAA